MIGDVAEIFAICVGIDINDGLDVVVIDNRTRFASGNLGHIPKNLKRSLVSAKDWEVTQRV